MDNNLFNELVENLESKKSFQKKNRSIYEGTYSAYSLGIALPKKLDRVVSAKLPWGKIAVDNLLQDVSFDGFRDDELGFTKILYRYGGYEAIHSAQKNSMIGACSFVTVLPSDEGDPMFTVYTGSEATAKWDSRDGFVAGLVENTKSITPLGNSYTVVDYLLFEPGYVHLVSDVGKILKTNEMPTDTMLFVPFVFGQDVAVKPFGETRYNDPFVSALESGLRNQKNMDIASEINLSRGKVLLSEGSLETGESVMVGDVEANLAELMIIKSVSGTTMKLADLGTADTKELRDNLSVCATNAAAAVSMDPTAFGHQPANGSFSEETINVLSKPYTKLVDDSRLAYGKSIRELAIATMSLATGQYHQDWEDIDPVFRNDFSVDKLGAVGDGLGKLLSLEGASDKVNEFINEKVLGLGVRDEALRVNLPDFSVSREAAKSMDFKPPTQTV